MRLLYLKQTILACILLLGYSVANAQTATVTLSYKDSPLSTVLSSIEKQLGKSFFYEDKLVDLKGNVSISVKNADVSEVLTRLFEGRNVTFHITDKHIVLNSTAPQAKADVTQKKASAAERYTISGNITEYGKTHPLRAVVSIAELGLWASTDDKGSYVLRSVPAGTYILQVSALNYKTELVTINVEKNISNQSFVLRQESLLLESVVVTAQKGNTINSSSRIEMAALEHVQPSSLTDVMQLVPGNITTNPKMSSVNHIVIRDTKPTDVNALGTSIIVDGANVSNNANMQFDKASSIAPAIFGSSVGSGVDTRQISTDNIESVEVIRGVASAEYGDLTSGAVIVKTKSGYTPWNVRLKTDPSSKQVAVGKGVVLGKDAGAINVDADYLLSSADPRTLASAYNRYNLQLGYSNTLFNKSKTPLRMDVKVAGNYSEMTTKADADRFLDDKSEARDQMLRISTNGTWMLNKRWITNLTYNLSGSFGDQLNRVYAYRRYSGARFTNSTESGESVGYIMPDGSYYSDVSVEGKPYDMQAKVVGNLIRKYGHVNNKLLLGFEWVTQGNNGDGKKTADPLKPDDPGSVLRNRSYKDIPAMNRYSLFAEDKVTIPISTTSLEVQAGLRLTNIQPQGMFNTDFAFSWEPRFNVRYNILRHQLGFNYLRARGSWGIQRKMPTMMYLSPDPVYTDKSSYAYNDPTNSYGLAVFSTQKIASDQIINPNLTTPKSTNIEAGIEFSIGSVTGSVVYFNEKLRNGFSLQQICTPYVYRKYTTGQPSGSFPTYLNGEVVIAGTPVPYTTDTTFNKYYKPNNGAAYNKWGIEYTLDLATIKAIKTSINLSGAYMHIERTDNCLEYQRSLLKVLDKDYPYVGIYGGGGVINNSVNERLSATLRFITHVPAIRMIVTLTAEGVFIDRLQNLADYNGQTMAYYYDAGGNRISGAQVYNDNTYLKRVNPIYYMDMKGVIRPFTSSMEQDAKYAELVDRNSYANVYAPNSYPFYGLLNLRLTKEIGNYATVSFYANNFLDIAGRVKDSNRQVYKNMNIPLYFGAEVKFTF